MVKNLDRIIAIATLCIGALILFISVGLGRMNQGDIGAAVFISSLLYLIFRIKIINENPIQTLHVTYSIDALNQIIFMTSISLNLWILWNNLYFRPTISIVLFLITAASIIFEIFYSNRSSLILFKIVILSMIIRASLYYEFPGIYGVDPWAHNAFVQGTIDTGHIYEGTPWKYNSYYVFPIFHIAGAIVQIISSLNVYNAIFISIGFFETISCIFVFLIGKKLADAKIGLLSALIFNLCDFSILWGVSVMPMSLGFYFASIIIYMILCKDRMTVAYKTMLIIISIDLILTHTIASFITSIVLVVIYVANNLYRIIDKVAIKRQTIVSMGFVALFFILMLTTWMSNAQPGITNFFEKIVSGLSNSISHDIELTYATTASNTYISTIDAILNHGGYLILLGLSCIGSLIWLYQRNYKINRFAMISIIAILIIITNVFRLFSLGNILTARWFIFMYIPLSIIGMYGLINISNVIKNNNIRFVTVLFVSIAILFLMMGNSITNVSNPIFAKESTYRTGYTQSELTALVTLSEISVQPKTDLYYAVIIPHIVGYEKYHNMTSSESKVFILRNYNLHNPKNDEKYRAAIHGGRHYKDYEQHNHVNIYKYLDDLKINDQSLIYNNRNVKAYYLTI